MSWIAICNIIIVNIIVLLALSYFWSGWNYKVFKPWLWLEVRKRKQIHKDIETTERHIEDKIRFYSHWFALEQIDANHVEGDIVIIGTENVDIPLLSTIHSNERKLYVVDMFESRSIEIVRENCQGEVSRQKIDINGVDIDKIKNALNNDSNTFLLKGNISEEVNHLNNIISFASIDTVDYDELLNSLKHVYPLLSEGGIILVHDYNHNWETVKNAVDRFEAGIVENFIWLPDMYGTVALIKNKKR